MNKFKERMSLLTTKELLKITRFLKDDYQEEAIKAAEDVLRHRNVSPDEMNVLTDELNEDLEEKSKPSPFEKKLKETSELFNPLEKHPTQKKWIKYLSIVFAISYIGSLWGNVNYVYYSLFVFEEPDLFGTLYLIPIIYLPICIVNLWRFNPLGWKLSSLYFSLSFVSLVIMAIESFYKIFKTKEEPSSFLAENSVQFMEETNYEPYKLVAQLIIIALVFKFLNKTEVLDIFQIERKGQKRYMIYPIIIGLIIFIPIIVLLTFA